jgi:hypothetical protein
MNDANYEPDWGAVLLARDMKIDGAVALSMGVDPGKLFLWKSRAPRSDVQEYERRLGLVRQWRLPGPNAIAVGYGVGGAPTIYLREFAEHLLQTGWSIPIELVTWATRHEQQQLPPIQVDDGSTPNPPSEGPFDVLAAKPQASSVAEPNEASPPTAAQSPGISAHAQQHYDDAFRLYPDFHKEWGGISKAARAVAKGDMAKFSAIRRDLGRVLKVKRRDWAKK